MACESDSCFNLGRPVQFSGEMVYLPFNQMRAKYCVCIGCLDSVMTPATIISDLTLVIHFAVQCLGVEFR